jgi:hypothetical protein
VSSRELLDNDFALARGEESPSEPIEFVRDEGRKLHDVIGTTYATLSLVSERFLDVLREHSFTGWTTFPVRVLLDDESGLPPPVPGGRSANEAYAAFASLQRPGTAATSSVPRTPPALSSSGG